MSVQKTPRIKRTLLNPPEDMTLRGGKTVGDLGVDGIIYVNVSEGLTEKYPFRRYDDGGKLKNNNTHIWAWLNPNEPLDDVTLYPGIRIRGVRYWIREGELHKID